MRTLFFALLAAVAASSCGSDTTAGGGGTGGGGGGVAKADCPPDPLNLPACHPDGDEGYHGLECSYPGPCPTTVRCSPGYTHGGWLERPPAEGSACDMDGKICSYEDPDCDAGFTTKWTATCSAGAWAVGEQTEPICF